MLGVWPLTSVEERETVSFLILHLPTDGRIEVVIREAQPDNPPPAPEVERVD